MTQHFQLFKAYDIRGTSPIINKKVYYFSGFAFVQQIIKEENLPLTVIVARDCRLTSPEFYDALVQGITDAGAEVIAIGHCTTDTLYAATLLYQCSGCMVTASHNPKDDNGIKIVKKVPQMLGLEGGLDKVRDTVLAVIDETELPQIATATTNELARNQVIDFFITKIQEVGDSAETDDTLTLQNRKLKIAVDCGNGMGGYIMPYIKELYTNIEFVPLFWELDGNFPNHPADPQNINNLIDLKKAVIDQKCDFGIAFDGDGDRAFFVDENGEPLPGDFLVALFAETLLKDKKQGKYPEFNNAVVYCQPGSRLAIDVITENDGVAIPSKQGHTYIKSEVDKYKAIYGGEFSGHHYFGQFGSMDSGAIAVSLMIKIYVTQNKKFSDLFARYTDEYFVSDLMNLKIPAGQTFADVKSRIEEYFHDARISEMDGVSIFYPDWKFSMRPSNTEPLIRFILETTSIDSVQNKIELVRRVGGV
jgi:phosphomannomutase